MQTLSSQPLPSQIHCTIVGGGIAGLTAALTLQAQGIPVSIVDKGQGIGGRLASRRLRWEADPQMLGVADYGALQFHVTDDRFQVQVDRWVNQGLLRWDGVGGYTGTSSLRSFTQALSQGLDLHLKTRVTQLHWQASTGQWMLSALDGSGTPVRLPWSSTHLLITCPVPQTLDLLEHSDIPIPPEPLQALQTVSYHPCLTALLLLKSPSQVPPAGLRAGLDSELPVELQALRCHYRSGISPQGYAVTLQAAPAFSQHHWNAEEPWILETLITLARPWLTSPVLTQYLHRWRYSQPAHSYAQNDRPYCMLQPNLILGGDAFATREHPEILPNLSVQQGFLSGLSAAEALLDSIDSSGPHPR